MKKSVLRNFAKFIGKHLCQSLFFNKDAGLGQLIMAKYSMLMSRVDSLKIKKYFLYQTITTASVLFDLNRSCIECIIFLYPAS